MGFITCLPKSEGFATIVVVVDRFSKYVTFIPTPKECSAEDTTKLFFKHVVKYWGLLKSIISDCDKRFTGRLWTELLKLMGMSEHFALQALTRRLMGKRESEHFARAILAAFCDCQPA